MAPAAGARPAAGRLAVDARALHASGIGRYLRELLAHWLAEPPFAALTLLGGPAQLRDFVAAHPSSMPVTVVPHDGSFYSPAAQFSWLRNGPAAVAGAAATFFPHWDAPLVRMPRRSIVAVHDLIPFRVPDAFPAARRALARPAFARVVATAARIVCGSDATAADLLSMHPRARARVCVIPYGTSARFAGDAPAGGGMRAPYLLCVGNQKPHKNLTAAVGVLAALRAAGYPELRLAVVGRRFGGGVSAAARAAGIADAVDDLGEVDDARLHALYAGCIALLFPSRYEGFGLPVVEAMAAGAPVVASATAGVAEAVGGVAPVHAPDDVLGMAAAVRALIERPAWREALARRGRARAARLSWGITARETARVLGEVAASSRDPARLDATAPRAVRTSATRPDD